MYYFLTTTALRTRLRFIQAKEDAAGKPTREHLAWMLDQMNTFDQASIEGAIKAACWIGWLLLAAEQLGFWSNAVSRALIREDKRANNHLPLLTQAITA